MCMYNVSFVPLNRNGIESSEPYPSALLYWETTLKFNVYDKIDYVDLCVIN